MKTDDRKSKAPIERLLEHYAHDPQVIKDKIDEYGIDWGWAVTKSLKRGIRAQSMLLFLLPLSLTVAGVILFGGEQGSVAFNLVLMVTFALVIASIESVVFLSRKKAKAELKTARSYLKEKD